MANEEHLKVLRQGKEAWHALLSASSGRYLDLAKANLQGADLRGYELCHASLRRADLRDAVLWEAQLEGAYLDGADLRGAILDRANLITASISRARLEEASLRRASLCGATLEGAKLCDADLQSANLEHASLRHADLSGAFLRSTRLSGANLEFANLSRANLSHNAELFELLENCDDLDASIFEGTEGGADLTSANLSGTEMKKSNLRGAILSRTIFNDVDLSLVEGLDECRHVGPSCVDHRTIARSKGVSMSFWRSCGLPDTLIDYIPALTDAAIQFYSCFISYSSKDQEFARRLYADLQDKGVRCWFAPHDLPIGAKILDGIDEAIRMRDKVVLILSEGAIASDWVEDEVTTTFDEEHRRSKVILFPVRLDDCVLEAKESWASKLRTRNIGDFTRWKEHDAYKATFERILRDLRATG